jgi:HlyD family secretion protein
VVSENRRPAFKVRIGLKKDELKRLGRSAIGPGMEAEVMLTGPKRTALSFLLKPMTDQLERTFRER